MIEPSLRRVTPDGQVWFDPGCVVQGARSALRHDGEPWATLAWGPERLAQRSWPQGQPRAQDLELAIDTVEDAVEGADLHHAPRGSLWLDASLVAQRAPLLAGVPAAGVGLDAGRTRDQVEAAFSALVAQVQAGCPATAQGPTLAALLMLRELMHHLGFVRVVSHPN